MIYSRTTPPPITEQIYYTDVNHNEDIFEAATFIGGVKQKFADINDLRKQWKAVADKFVKHIWIYRYTDDDQKKALEKHYANLCDENCFYSTYKRSFKAICKFMGLPHDKVIIENMVFTKNKKDKEMWQLSLKYSKGFARIEIPEGVQLTHVSPVDNIKELIPSFRSKVKGKYMYPTRRVFFTVAKEIRKNQAGLEGKKLTAYTPKENIRYAYIDPTYADFASGSVYIETETPIPVITIQKKLLGLIKVGKE